MGDSILTETIEAQIIPEVRPAMTSREFLKFATDKRSLVANYPILGDPGAASSVTDDLSEITSTALSDTQVAVTAAEVGFRVDVTDLSEELLPWSLTATAAQVVARSLAEKWETDLAALMDDFANVTTAASTLTPVDVLAAVSALEQRDIPGPYVGYFDPKQTGELRQEIATTTASYQIGRNGELVRPFADSGWFGEYMGLPIWQTSLVVTTSSLVGGAVFNTTDCLGALEIRAPRVESQRDASYRSLELVGSAVYGLIEIQDTWGQTVKSAA